MIKHTKIEVNEFEELLNEWLDEFPYLKKSKNTQTAYIKAINDFKTFLTENPTDEIDTLTVEDFKDYLDQKFKTNTVKLKLTVINRVFKDLGHPDIRADMDKDETDQINTKGLTQDEYFTLLEWAKKLGKDRIGLLIETLAQTSIRISELKYLTKESLKLQFFEVKNKGKRRFAFIPDDLKKKLNTYCRKNKIKSGMIFHGRMKKDKKGNPVLDKKTKAPVYNPMDQAYIRRELKAIAEVAGGEDLKAKAFPHNFRHFAGTVYAGTSGANPYLIPVILGHSKTHVTEVYTAPSDLKDILDLMNRGQAELLENQKEWRKQQREEQKAKKTKKKTSRRRRTKK